MKKIFFLLALLFSISAHAYYEIYVHIVDRKGVDNNFILTDELHSIEPFINGKVMRVEMTNGINLELKVDLKKESKNFVINGVLKDKHGKEIGMLQPVNRAVPVGAKIKYVLNDKEKQIVEVTLQPVEK